MHVYHYCLCLLALIVVLIQARYIDDDLDDELSLPNNYYVSRAFRSHALERYLRNLLAHDDEKDEQAMSFERRGKAITKGDPREFMG